MSSATMPDMKPYPEYKESGTSWVGKVPSHWKVLPNRAIFVEVNDPNHPHEQMLSVTINQGVISQKELLEDNSQRDGSRDDKSSYKLVLPGDIAYNKMRAWQGAIGLSNHKGIVSPAYVVQRPIDGLNPHYLHLLLRTPSFATEAERWSYGITSDMWSLRSQHFKAIHSCVPPADEQTAIVRYLDAADQRIRDYVSAKERLIVLLEEERQAVIHQAVTRGLDSNVNLRPSGVEWLGDVPKHWEIAQFARQIEIAEGQVDPKAEPYASMLVIAPNHVESGTGRLLSRETAFEQGAISGKYICRDGDVIYSKIRPALAKVVVAPTDCLCSADMYPVRPRNTLQRDYLFWLLLSTGFTAWSTAQSDRVAMPKVNRQTLNNTYIPLPPHPEQASIAQYVTEATEETSKVIDRARRQIELMEEYRTRLIADVVTGKIDVREAKP